MFKSLLAAALVAASLAAPAHALRTTGYGAADGVDSTGVFALRTNGYGAVNGVELFGLLG